MEEQWRKLERLQGMDLQFADFNDNGYGAVDAESHLIIAK
jgi:hypothetical protein